MAKRHLSIEDVGGEHPLFARAIAAAVEHARASQGIGEFGEGWHVAIVGEAEDLITENPESARAAIMEGLTHDEDVVRKEMAYAALRYIAQHGETDPEGLELLSNTITGGPDDVKIAAAEAFYVPIADGDGEDGRETMLHVLEPLLDELAGDYSHGVEKAARRAKSLLGTLA